MLFSAGTGLRSNQSTDRHRLFRQIARAGLHMRKFTVIVISLATIWTCDHALSQERCGATERWAVKLGTDPDAAQVDRGTIRDITVGGLNQLPQLRDNVPAHDNETRLPEERVVYRVSGRLALFKNESDSDYHLVITDDSLKFTPGGSGTEGEETGTSFIAEIPDPQCYMGTHGAINNKSQFEDTLRDVRIKFERRFPGGEEHDTDLGGIPVTLTGVAFYDRQHEQTGRAVNGIELHPLLDIVFNDQVIAAAPAGVASPLTATALFRPGGNWTATKTALRERPLSEEEEEDDEGFGGEPVRVGGTGHPNVHSIWQTERIRSAAGATLRFALRIKTDNRATSPSRDTLVVRLRTKAGKPIKTLATFTNGDAARRIRQVSFDMSRYRGQTVRIQFTSNESSTKNTQFIIGNPRVEYR
jgi:hypothetical protein